MITLPGYLIYREIYTSAHSRVYRGRRESDDLPVVIKIHNKEYPTPREIARCKREYKIARRLNFDGVVSCSALETYKNDLALVMEDSGGESLARIFKSDLPELDLFLRIGIELARILSEIHRRGVIHKDIKPANIIYNSRTEELKFIDFGISSLLEKESNLSLSPGKLEGTLRYMSPEQTGRTNSGIDYRTDIYSLGVTLYELLTGKTPFTEGNSRELMFSHLARSPVAPGILKSELEIPEALDLVIMKLIAKSPEERYQSAYGLKRDLEYIRQILPGDGDLLKGFFPAQYDRNDRFLIRDTLYGRETEVAELLDAFNRVAGGETRLLLVAGRSGIGKSALVNEVRRPILENKGYFIDGKFEQFKRDIPFHALVQAFTGLIRQVLTEEEEEIEIWRTKIAGALGKNAQVIARVIPELEVFITPGEILPELGPDETKNRFLIYFQKFIGVFLERDRPLCLFLDDLQWADRASLELLESFLTDPDSHHLLIIGAYRDNEIDATHVLAPFLEQLEPRIEYIKPGPMNQASLGELLSDSFHCELEQAQGLARLILPKTGGNPFFVRQFLHNLNERGLLRFDPNSGEWQWDEAIIASQAISDNVALLMVERLALLPGETRALINMAACQGNQFELSELSYISQYSPARLAEILEAALLAGLIITRGDAYKYIAEQEDAVNAKETVSYRFLHDRVQQAAYSTLEESERRQIHLKIGRRLLEIHRGESRREKISDIVIHLNFARDTFDAADSRTELIELNLEAALKAKASADFQGALIFFRVARELLPGNAWENMYSLALKVYIELAETEYACTNFTAAEGYFQIVLENAVDIMDKIRVYEIRLWYLASRHQYKTAIETGELVLAELGKPLPENINPELITQEYNRVYNLLGNLSADEIIQSGEMSDPIQLAEARVVFALTTVAYNSNTGHLSPYLAAYILRCALEHGIFPEVSFAFAASAMVSYGIYCEFDTGQRLIELSLKVSDYFNISYIRGRVLMIYGHLTLHWEKPMSKKKPILIEGYEMSLESGDLEYASYYIFALACTDMFSTGSDVLESINKKMKNYSTALLKLGQGNIELLYYIIWQLVDNLMGKSENFEKLIGEKLNEDLHYEHWLESGSTTNLYILHYARLLLYYLAGNYEYARESSEAGIKYEMFSFPGVPSCNFLYSLSLAALWDKQGEDDRAETLAQISKNQELMKLWSARCPENFLHMYKLVEAEQGRIAGEHTRAAELYEDAAEYAREQNYYLVLALSNELAARFYRKQKRARFEELYIREAYYAYMNWGAVAKMRLLEREYPDLLRYFHSPGKLSERIQESRTTMTTEMTGTYGQSITAMTQMDTPGGERADLLAAIGELALASEKSTLIETYMNVCMKFSGAGRAFLFMKLPDAETFTLEARGSIVEDDIRLFNSIPAAGVKDLPQTVLIYVERTGEELVIENISQDERFLGDPYIRENEIRSVLCVCFKMEGRGQVLFYLENNLITGAFDFERVALLRILTRQLGLTLSGISGEKNFRAEFSDENQKLALLLEELKTLRRENRPGSPRYEATLEEIVKELGENLETETETESS